MVFLQFLLYVAAFIGIIKLIIWVDEKAPKRVRHNITPTPSPITPIVAASMINGGCTKIVHAEHIEINPATGLPMIGGIGGVYAAGNMFGDDRTHDHFDPKIAHTEHIEINPATGLPMIGGIGGVDAAGNMFGDDRTHDHFDHFDSFGSIDHNH